MVVKPGGVQAPVRLTTHRASLLCHRPARYSIERGKYNAVLTGAAFLDTWTALPAYWAPAVAPARQAVDRVFNGEDLLMNFVLANASAGAPGGAAGNDAIEFMRPTVRRPAGGAGVGRGWVGRVAGG